MIPFQETSSSERVLYDMAIRQGIPIHGSFELTPLCTMNCRMCFVRLSPEEMAARGRLLRLEEWLDLAEQLKKAGTLFLLLTGGEPLLYPHFKELYLKLRKMGFFIMLNTNATLIDEAWADFFRENPPRRFNITLYGANAEDYEKVCRNASGFEKTLRGIRLLKERDLPVKLSGSLIHSNLPSMEDYLAICDGLELPAMTESYMIPACRERFQPFPFEERLTPEEYAKAKLRLIPSMEDPQYIDEDLRHTLQKFEENRGTSEEPTGFRCKAGKCSFAINWQGHMRPCVLLREPEIDLHTVSFLDAWQQIRTLCAPVSCDPKCTSCEYRSLCPRCPAADHAETGSFGKAPSYLCDCMKALDAALQDYVAAHPAE